jgi:hypothetical protein
MKKLVKVSFFDNKKRHKVLMVIHPKQLHGYPDNLDKFFKIWEKWRIKSSQHDGVNKLYDQYLIPYKREKRLNNLLDD